MNKIVIKVWHGIVSEVFVSEELQNIELEIIDEDERPITKKQEKEIKKLKQIFE